jgi:hypothetical protein
VRYRSYEVTVDTSLYGLKLTGTREGAPTVTTSRRATLDLAITELKKRVDAEIQRIDHEEMKKAHPGGINAMLDPRSK